MALLLVACTSEQTDPVDVVEPVDGMEVEDAESAADTVDAAQPQDTPTPDVEPPDAGPADVEPPDVFVDSGPDLTPLEDVPPPPVLETVAAGACGEAVPIECGESFSLGTKASATGQVVDQTQCSTFSYPGPEIAFVFTAPGEGKAKVLLETGGDTLDLHVLAAAEDGCDLDQCLLWGPAEGGKFEVASGDVAYLIVDGYLGAKGTFDLTLDCGDLEIKAAQCKEQASVSCGDNLLVALDTPGQTQQVSDYGCGQSGYTGPERAFLFTSPVTGAVSATVGGADDAIFVLDADFGCDPTKCVAAAEDGTVTFDAVEGRSYQLVVDTKAGFTASFSVALACP